MDLTRSAWTEIAAAAPATVLVPVGSCEQHGPHLPFDTDTRIAVAVASAVARRLPDVHLAPPLSYGSSGEHQAFDGTLSIGTGALTAVLVELGRSALPADGGGAFVSLVFVNGHGGNHDAVTAAVRRLADEGRAVSSWSPAIEGGDAHAGRSETALLLAIDPSVVGDERPTGNVAPLRDIVAELRTGGVAAVSPNGVLGDATGADAETGRQILDHLVDDLAAHVTRSGRAPSRRTAGG
ncbi:mycofactocin biosynthesis peptidyl-dipeptidase MftE [Actinospongicola halichondriae]|uniref:mycofactocin biosynthesis peptidyl-dipeptidase MftE n=1 Tax=Actinospongicola halichondriae TaxID=3236844 RepID=UPI003D5B906E